MKLQKIFLIVLLISICPLGAMNWWPEPKEERVKSRKNVTDELITLLAKAEHRRLQRASIDPQLNQKVKDLLARGADPNVNYEIYMNRTDIDNPTIQRNEGTALIVHVRNFGDPELISILLKAGANPSAIVHELFQALSHHEKRLLGPHYLIDEKINFLLSTGINPNSRDQFTSSTLLMTAIYFRAELPIVERLLNAGANPNLQDWHGTTALMMAVFNNDTGIVRLLLEKRADPNIQDNLENTALIYAVSQDSQNSEIIRLLLDHGARPELKNKANKSALSIAQENAQLPLMSLLERYVKN